MGVSKLTDKEFIEAWGEAYASGMTIGEFRKQHGYATASIVALRRRKLIDKGHGKDLPKLKGQIASKHDKLPPAPAEKAIPAKVVSEPVNSIAGVEEGVDAAYMAGLMDGKGDISFLTGDHFGVTVGLVVGIGSKYTADWITKRYGGLRTSPGEHNSEVYMFSWRGAELYKLIEAIAPHIKRFHKEMDAMLEIIVIDKERDRVIADIAARFKKK